MVLDFLDFIFKLCYIDAFTKILFSTQCMTLYSTTLKTSSKELLMINFICEEKHVLTYRCTVLEKNCKTFIEI